MKKVTTASGTQNMTEHLEGFLRMPAQAAAPRLLGCLLERELDGQVLRVRIVETEAYDQTDAASHSYKGRTPRTDIMFGPAGRLYVYFTYGMHYCCNIVTGNKGEGSAVLIRAVEPLSGEEILEQRRKGKHGIALTNGPAKLCEALGIDKRMNGHYLEEAPLKLILQPALKYEQIITTTRVGISKAKDVLWRFYIKDNSYVSQG
ncbi:MAG TPA: DNA-3-methyladenine glycosylase [Candidatus Saccharimonadales bacterium]|nr:DNA-3-methyladenine glycosylase [Candidatus Saccharimonadales bacterium]